MSTESKAAKNGKSVKELINVAFGSKLFPFITAAIVIFCYYTGLDLVAIYYVAIVGILILTLCEDLTPFITLLVFLNVIISYQHSPSEASGNSDYFFQTAVAAQVICVLVLIVSAGVIRLLRTVHQRRFRPTPIFYGLCALSLAFILNGIFSKNYTPMNLVYGLFQTVIYLGVFALLKDNIKVNGKTFGNIAVAFLALSVVLVAELFIAYFSTEGIYVNGELYRGRLSFGWGVYNTMGMLLLLCVPSVVYLASVYKRGWLLTLYSVLLVLCCILSMSRQAMLGVAVIYPLCLIYLIKRTKQKLINWLIIGAACIGTIAIVAIRWHSFTNAFSQIFSNIIVDGQLNGSGRMKLYGTAINEFFRAPLFGTGFYSGGLDGMLYNASGMDIIPLFYHNTILQMAASCGVIGLAAYIVHRCQTVFSFFKNITVERSYIAVSILALLVLSLLDVHMFDILPTLLYSSFVAVLVASEKDKKKTKLERPKFIIQI